MEKVINRISKFSNLVVVVEGRRDTTGELKVAKGAYDHINFSNRGKQEDKQDEG